MDNGSEQGPDTHEPYIAGYKDGTFKPNGTITRAEAAQLLYNVSGKSSSGTSKFSDVSPGNWYHKAVSYLADSGVISGYPDSTFKPNMTISRAELVTLAIKYAKLPVSNGSINFPDVSSDHWAKGSIEAASQAGWIEGYPKGAF